MFHKKFAAIPDEQWCIYVLEFDGARCALGHTMGETLYDTEETKKLRELFGGTRDSDRPAIINNGDSCMYKQPTPKARILAALEDIIRQ